MPSVRLTTHPLYRTWAGMIQRCETPSNNRYERYGGRGIKVCKQWRKSFVSFAQDMKPLGPRPKGMILDRIDNDGNYEPGNLRWTTHLESSRNRDCVLQYKPDRIIAARSKASQVLDSSL